MPTLVLTPKAIAILSAVESGMIPKITNENGEEGFDDTAFERFWENFSDALTIAGRFDQPGDVWKMLEEVSKKRREDSEKDTEEG